MAINTRNLLSSEARIQIPWINVTFKCKDKDYTFGVYTRNKSTDAYYTNAYVEQFPKYIQSINITKINGQVNKYTLNLVYPVTHKDDPNFFEKLFSSMGTTRKIIFSYGDYAVPSFAYKEEEAILTTISKSFNLTSSTISYTINAISGVALFTSGCVSFPARNNTRPSAIIREIFNKDKYGLRKVFTGMSKENFDRLVATDDDPVDINAKTNINIIDYLSYLVSCMRYTKTKGVDSGFVYILTIHDDYSYDSIYDYNPTFLNNEFNRELDISNEKINVSGPYFKVSKVNYNNNEKSDAYEIDIGYNTSAIVTDFSLQDNTNYSIYYQYQGELEESPYVRRINDDGTIEEIDSPSITSNNSNYITQANDVTWWTKVTQFPVSANITIQGLLRPAQLLTYVRLNIIFPGGNKYIGSGLYLITSQKDTVDGNGYRTELTLVKVGGATIK